MAMASHELQIADLRTLFLRSTDTNHVANSYSFKECGEPDVDGCLCLDYYSYIDSIRKLKATASTITSQERFQCFIDLLEALASGEDDCLENQLLAGYSITPGDISLQDYLDKKAQLGPCFTSIKDALVEKGLVQDIQHRGITTNTVSLPFTLKRFWESKQAVRNARVGYVKANQARMIDGHPNSGPVYDTFVRERGYLVTAEKKLLNLNRESFMELFRALVTASDQWIANHITDLQAERFSGSAVDEGYLVMKDLPFMARNEIHLGDIINSFFAEPRELRTIEAELLRSIKARSKDTAGNTPVGRVVPSRFVGSSPAEWTSPLSPPLQPTLTGSTNPFRADENGNRPGLRAPVLPQTTGRQIVSVWHIAPPQNLNSSYNSSSGTLMDDPGLEMNSGALPPALQIMPSPVNRRSSPNPFRNQNNESSVSFSGPPTPMSPVFFGSNARRPGPLNSLNQVGDEMDHSRNGNIMMPSDSEIIQQGGSYDWANDSAVTNAGTGNENLANRLSNMTVTGGSRSRGDGRDAFPNYLDTHSTTLPRDIPRAISPVPPTSFPKISDSLTTEGVLVDSTASFEARFPVLDADDDDDEPWFNEDVRRRR